MAEPAARLWLKQAEADLLASERVLITTDAGTYCQAIAKYQQTVEKSVKAIRAALNSAGIANVGIGFNHDVEMHVTALLRLPRSNDNRTLQNQIFALLDQTTRGEVKSLSGLAPKRPAPGEMFRRNTEYPYQEADGTWHVPSDPNAFFFGGSGTLPQSRSTSLCRLRQNHYGH